MKKNIVFILYALILLLAGNANAQLNLVPNPSFEDSLGCPHGSYQLNLTNNWCSGYGTPDYFRDCGTNGYCVPINYGGSELAHTGVAYVEIGVFHIVVHNGREFIEVKLNDTLVINKRYCVEFYVSLMDNAKYAIWNIGVYFSNSGIYGNTLSQILALSPQVINDSGNFITNKNGWTKILGTFIAKENEKYITIGNFEDDSIIDTLFVDSSPSIPNDWRGSYYYIDDVSVTLCDDTTGVFEKNNAGKINVNIYPNPSNDKLYIKLPAQINAAHQSIEVFNPIGISVLMKEVNATSQNEQSLDISGLPCGLYMLRLLMDEQVYSAKFIKQ